MNLQCYNFRRQQSADHNVCHMASVDLDLILPHIMPSIFLFMKVSKMNGHH